MSPSSSATTIGTSSYNVLGTLGETSCREGAPLTLLVPHVVIHIVAIPSVPVVAAEHERAGADIATDVRDPRFAGPVTVTDRVRREVPILRP
jgi:hypothetical protein